MRPRLDRCRALLGMMLREQGRERAESLLTLLILLGSGLGVGFLPPDALRPEASTGGPTWTCGARPAEPPAVAVAGEIPAWLRWPEPLVEAERAEVLLRVGARKIEVVPLVEEARLGAVTPCLKLRVAEERARRMDALGVSAGGEPMLVVEAAGEPPPSRVWQPTPGRSAVAGALAMVALSGGMSAAARARSSGLRESIAAGPVRAEEWTLALLGFALFSSALCGLLVTAGLAAASLLGGQPLDLPSALPSLLAPLFLASLALRAGHDASDYVSAMGRIVALTFAAMMLVGASLLLDRVASPWGVLVPAGPLLRAMVGEPIGGGALLASAGITALGALLLLLATVRAVAADDPTLAPSARVTLRRAAGRYGPEALLAGIIGFAGSFFTSPLASRGDPLPAFLLSQLAFQLLPALLAPTVLGLRAGPLIGLRWPAARALAVTPLVLAGTLGAGLGVAKLAMGLLPPPEEALRQLMENLDLVASGPGILLLTVGAGVCEELLYRGLVLGLLLERGRVARAILLQAALFAIAHALGFRLAPTFVIGVLLGVLRWRTGSLLPGMLVHAAHNATSLLGVEALGLDRLPWWAMLGGAALGVLGLGLARGPSKQPPGAS